MASAQPTRLQSKSPKWRGVKGRVWGRYVVPGEGLEPSWAEARRILSPLRLPIPPSRRRGWQKQISTAYVRAAACDFHSKLNSYRLSIILILSVVLMEMAPSSERQDAIHLFFR